MFKIRTWGTVTKTVKAVSFAFKDYYIYNAFDEYNYEFPF